MDLRDIIISLSNEAYGKYVPHISLDCVVFGFHESTLKVLLTRLKGEGIWVLPGGYLGQEEDLKSAASRILTERTGVSNIYLQQFKVFSEMKRSEGFFADYPDDLWHKMRFLTVGFYALVDYTKVDPVTDKLADACEWKEVNNLPQMAMDHKTIVEKALVKLRRELNYKPIGYNLLPEEFTMPELQKLYETLLGKPLNRGNFYRKMIAYDILDKQPEPRKGGAHKAPNLYKFNLDRYNAALKDGLKEGW
ncbi:MAG: NUDIX hydrolase [Bacteroidia bacterium]|jgi:8-oxo-dGTP diphosphatase